MKTKLASLCSALLLIFLIIPNTGSSEESRYTSSESSSKNSSESTDTGSSPAPTNTDSTPASIQSNCKAIDASGALVPGVWVPMDNMTISAANQGNAPEIERIENYRDIRGM